MITVKDFIDLNFGDRFSLNKHDTDEEIMVNVPGHKITQSKYAMLPVKGFFANPKHLDLIEIFI